jgi:hypothetical protein
MFVNTVTFLPVPTLTVAAVSIPESVVVSAPALLPTLLPAIVPLSSGSAASNAIMLPQQEADLLPEFTSPGDETATLMLPAAPEISHLPQAFAAAARRFTEQPPATITFFDPITGDDTDPSLSAVIQSALEQPWLVIDAALDDSASAASARIRWNSAPN